jgi:glycosyltransferase involved in cell wall biosynthesis
VAGGKYTKLLPVGEYVICAKRDDPLVRPARARLIWAANTAAATAALGVPAVLAGTAAGLPFRVDSLAGIFAAKRRLNELYNVDTDFNVAISADPGASKSDQKRSLSPEFLHSVLPRAGLVHTRDPAVAIACARRKINYILEHHDEDYQNDFKEWDLLFQNSATCLALVAITEKVRETLMEEGVPPEKILVLDSGVNANAAVRRDEAAQSWRKHLLGGAYRKLVVYAGGMQVERGIADVMQAAEQMRDTLFVFCGGHPSNTEQWINAASDLRLGNVRFFGYLPHEVVCELQQAADAVVLTRAPTDRAAITSPLKFFEYLVSGTPIVSAQLPATSAFEGKQLAIEWYEPGSVDSLTTAFARSFDRFGYSAVPHEQNVKLGLLHTWEERQRNLFRFIGQPSVKTTF